MLTTRALVLKTVRYNDSRLMVSLYTERHGMISCVARLPRSKRAGSGMALWQVLNQLDITLDFRPMREVQTISEACISFPWQSIPYNPMKAAIAMFLGDFLFHSLKREGENTLLFEFLIHSLRWFDETNVGVSDFHLQLMLRLTRFIGILPGLENYDRHFIYDLQGACYTDVLPVHGQYLLPEEAQWLPVLLHMDYGRMGRLQMNAGKRRRMMEVLLDYYRLHVPAFGDLQSLDILREMFS